MSPLRRLPAHACAVALIPLLLSILPAVPAGAQDAPPPADAAAGDDWQPLDSFGEAISVEVTEIEVWVTDRQGNPVTGLDADDFVLSEDGDPMAITNFTAYTAEERGSWSTPTVDAPAGRETATGEGSGSPAESAGAAETADSAEPDEPAPSATPAAPGAAGTEELDPEQRLHLAILIDNWNLRPADRARVFDGLREFLNENFDDRDRAMVLAHDQSLALVQEMTGDRDELLAALERVNRAGSSVIQLDSERKSALRAIRDAYENARIGNPLESEAAQEIPDPCKLEWGQIQAQAQGYASSVMGHVQRSGAVLASSGDLLAGIPGRKVLVYVGSGLPQQAGYEMFHFLTELCPTKQAEIASWYSNYDLTWIYEEVARRANANGLTLFTVEGSAPVAGTDASVAGFTSGSEPRGGATGGVLARVNTSGQTFRPSAAAARSAELDQEAGLFYVANETGGRAILNAADFSRDFERLSTELRTYYSLGFTPDHQGDGRLHTLDVKLKEGVGDGYRVRHRQSYQDKPYEQRMAETIRGVAQFGTEANRMGVRVETGDATPTGTGYRVPIRLWVPLSELTLVDPGGPDGGADPRAGRLRVLMAVSDAAGNLGPVRQKLVTVEVGGGPGAEAVQGREHLVEVDLDLPTARHVVALGLRDELGGGTSFLRHEIRLDPVGSTDGTAGGDR